MGDVDAAPGSEAALLHARRRPVRGVALSDPGRGGSAGVARRRHRDRRRRGRHGVPRRGRRRRCRARQPGGAGVDRRARAGGSLGRPATGRDQNRRRPDQAPRHRRRRGAGDGAGPHPPRSLGGRPRLDGRRRPRRGPARSRSAGRAGVGDRRGLRLHRARADDHRTGRPWSLDRRDRRSAAPVRLHGAGPPQSDLRQVGHEDTRRARRPPVLRPAGASAHRRRSGGQDRHARVRDVRACAGRRGRWPKPGSWPCPRRC